MVIDDDLAKIIATLRQEPEWKMTELYSVIQRGEPPNVQALATMSDALIQLNATRARLLAVVDALEEAIVPLKHASEYAEQLNWEDHNSVFHYASHRKTEAVNALSTLASKLEETKQ